jgi:chaperonin GroES
MSLNIKPIGDRVVVEAAPAETMTASGIYIPETAQEKPQKGTIVAVGPGKYADSTGSLIPIGVNVGDQVLYGKYAGTEITYEGKELLIMRESDIYAVL